MGTKKAAGCVGMMIVVFAMIARSAEPVGPTGRSDQAAEINRLKDEIEQLKGMVPDQSPRDEGCSLPVLESLVRGQGEELASGFLPRRAAVASQMGRPSTGSTAHCCRSFKRRSRQETRVPFLRRTRTC